MHKCVSDLSVSCQLLVLILELRGMQSGRHRVRVVWKFRKYFAKETAKRFDFYFGIAVQVDLHGQYEQEEAQTTQT